MSTQETIVWKRYESILQSNGYMIEKNYNQSFRDYILPQVSIQYEQDEIPDIPARREAYNNYLDALMKEGAITEFYAKFIDGIPDELEELVIKIIYR